MTIFDFLSRYGKGPAPQGQALAVQGFGAISHLFRHMPVPGANAACGLDLSAYCAVAAVNREALAHWLGNLLAPNWEIQEDWPADRIGCLFREPVPVYLVTNESPGRSEPFLPGIAKENGVLLFCDGQHMKQTSWKNLLARYEGLTARAISDFITYDSNKPDSPYICIGRSDFLALGSLSGTKSGGFPRPSGAKLENLHMVIVPDDQDDSTFSESEVEILFSNEWICTYYVDDLGRPIPDSIGKQRAVDIEAFVGQKKIDSVIPTRSAVYKVLRKFARSCIEGHLIPTGGPAEQANRTRLKNALCELCAFDKDESPYTKKHRTAKEVGLAFHLCFSTRDAMKKIGISIPNLKNGQEYLQPPGQRKITGRTNFR